MARIVVILRWSGVSCGFGAWKSSNYYFLDWPEWLGVRSFGILARAA